MPGACAPGCTVIGTGEIENAADGQVVGLMAWMAGKVNPGIVASSCRMEVRNSYRRARNTRYVSGE